MSKLPINLNDLLRQRTIESERIEYKTGWNRALQQHGRGEGRGRAGFIEPAGQGAFRRPLQLVGTN